MKKVIVLTALLCAFVSCADSSKEKADLKEYVDLGLPSGTLWATCNVGASSPEESGDYYAWGDLKPATKQYSGNQCGEDFDISGKEEYDIARKKWGDNWRMPTVVECRELYRHCSFEWTTQNGRNGCKVTGPNGNSIFLPATGYMVHDEGVFDGESQCNYWTGSVVYPTTAYAFSYSRDNEFDRGVGSNACLMAYTIRPVCEDPNAPSNLARTKINGHEYVDLGLPSKLKWATCNVGAPTPDEAGDSYEWTDQYDVARNIWGDTWRMPTKEEFEELIGCCTWESKSGVLCVTGPNGNKIFIPEEIVNTSYWTSTPEGTGSAYSFHYKPGDYFNPEDVLECWVVGSYNKLKIRPVSE